MIDPPVDEDGYYRCDFWRLMQDFGAAISMAVTPPFEMTVLVED